MSSENQEFDKEVMRRANCYVDLLQALVEAKHLIQRTRAMLSMLMPVGAEGNPRGNTLADVDDVMTIIDCALDKCSRLR